MTSQAYAERILRFIKAGGHKPRQIHELAEAMGIGENEQGDFHAACKALMKTGRVVLGSRNALTLPEPPGRLTGVFRGNAQGFGFVVPESPNTHGDLYIPAGNTGAAVTGDTVVARVLKRGKRGGKMLYEGRIVEIVQRGRSRFVGELLHRLGRWLVIPEGNILHAPIVVNDVKAKNAREGDQAVVELTQFPTRQRDARGVIVRVLGRHGQPDVDTRSIIEQFQLPAEFSEEVLAEARTAAAGYDPRRDAAGREDLRHLTVITIDPADAKDFDDAISLTTRKDGAMELGVHIADVAHFVPEGGPLDREAKERSNSVYLARTVIPMLPETLSNDVCSLQQRQVRLTKSVFVTYDAGGNVRDARVANAVIRSTKRLTYEQAAAVLEGKRGRLTDNVVSLLRNMDKLARAIRGRRLRDGMLELDIPEAEPVYDAEGRVVDVRPADASFSHKVIEMFMVEANEAVARLLTSLNVPFLRRTHDQPRDLAAENLRRFLGALGHRLPADADRQALQKLLDAVRGKPESFPVHFAVLRSMPQAQYSPVPMGHFALASEAYCHFTSPIRRYPDLTIHRLLDAYLRGSLGDNAGATRTRDIARSAVRTRRHESSSRRGRAKLHGPASPADYVGRASPADKKTARNANRRQPDQLHIPDEAELVQLGRLCSTTERRAEAAERELSLLLTLRLLNEKYLGEQLDGVVTGVANMGLFVQLDRFLIDGLLRFDQLPDDWWEVDTTRGCVIGQRTGQRIRIGDPLRVVIARISIPTRQIDLALARGTDKTARRRKRRDARDAGRVEESSPSRAKKRPSVRRKSPRSPHRRSRRSR